MFTRNDLLAKKCTHREYYSQFVGPIIKEIVRKHFGKEKILNSTDEHLNDISLDHWDALHQVIAMHTYKKFEILKDAVTQSGTVCVAKEAAKQIREENKGEQS